MNPRALDRRMSSITSFESARQTGAIAAKAFALQRMAPTLQVDFSFSSRALMKLK